MTATGTLHRTPRHPWRWVGWLLLSQALAALAWGGLGWATGLPLLLASHALFVVPVFLPNSRFYGPVLTHWPQAGNRVWLTIDDGPSADTPALLALLARHQARATFFLIGQRAAAQPALVQAIIQAGHSIGNHSDSHPQAWWWVLGPRRLAAQIGQCQQRLASLSGRPPRWYRSVVGHTNPFVAAPLRAHGLARVAWTARGYDAVDGDPVRVLQRIGRDLAPGAIVLLHEGAAHGRSVEIVEATLCLLEERGYATLEPPA